MTDPLTPQRVPDDSTANAHAAGYPSLLNIPCLLRLASVQQDAVSSGGGVGDP